MSERIPATKPKTTYAPDGRPSRSAARANRAQVRAMQARAASARAPQFSDSEDAPPLPTLGGTAVAGRGRPVVRQAFLTRKQEYAYIRGDIRRLIITAGGLFVLMIVLLFILD